MSGNQCLETLSVDLAHLEIHFGRGCLAVLMETLCPTMVVRQVEHLGKLLQGLHKRTKVKVRQTRLLSIETTQYFQKTTRRKIKLLQHKSTLIANRNPETVQDKSLMLTTSSKLLKKRSTRLVKVLLLRSHAWTQTQLRREPRINHTIKTCLTYCSRQLRRARKEMTLTHRRSSLRPRKMRKQVHKHKAGSHRP